VKLGCVENAHSLPLCFDMWFWPVQ